MRKRLAPFALQLLRYFEHTKYIASDLAKVLHHIHRFPVSKTRRVENDALHELYNKHVKVVASSSVDGLVAATTVAQQLNNCRTKFSTLSQRSAYIKQSGLAPRTEQLMSIIRIVRYLYQIFWGFHCSLLSWLQ